MCSRTKKVGSLGRYGPRIGGKIRREIRKVEDMARQNRCPSCGRSVRRTASGIWKCRFCGMNFTGGAYYSMTERTMLVTGKSRLKRINVEPKKGEEERPKAKRVELMPEGRLDETTPQEDAVVPGRNGRTALPEGVEDAVPPEMPKELKSNEESE